MPTPTGTTAPPQTKTLESRVPGSVMVDVAAPPVPNRSNPLRKPTHAEATSKLKTGMGILIFGLVVGGALFYFGFKILGGAELAFSGGGNGAGEDVQVVGSSLLQCPQEGCGDEHGDWEQIVFGLAVAGHDEEIFGRESRAVRRVERGAPPSTLWCLGEGAVEQCLGRCRGVAHAGNHPYFRYATFTWATYSTPALVLTERAGELFDGE